MNLQAMTCPKCHRPAAAGNRFCGMCGAKLPEPASAGLPSLEGPAARRANAVAESPREDGTRRFNAGEKQHSQRTAASQEQQRPRPIGVLVIKVQPLAGPSCATRDNPWVNSLGMKFVPVPGTAVLFGIWDVRVRDYRAYADAVGGADSSWEDPKYEGVPVTPSPDCPVVNVNWQDATAFCRWLTKKERGEGKIGDSQSYRLPQELEWSRAVGNTKYPWGDAWPPPSGAGNYADGLAQCGAGGSTVIEGCVKDYVSTSPVGSFNANRHGLYDLGGNVWQWCEDWYDEGQRYRVLRGASWDGHIPTGLLSVNRLAAAPNRRHYKFGFRCVLEDSTSPLVPRSVHAAP